MKFLKHFFTKFEVFSNTTGYLYIENKFQQVLEPGVYSYYDYHKKIKVISLPNTPKMLVFNNQEVLSKDNIAFRFSFSLMYKIVDGLRFLSNFPHTLSEYYLISEAEQQLYVAVQHALREKIARFEAEELNEKRHEIGQLQSEELQQHADLLGIEIVEARVRDLTFPKAIQDLFAKHLEAKISSRADLENARTAVATARALKNASELMKGDDNIRFVQLLETLTKIAEKGKHTFMIGDLHQIISKKD